MAEGKKEGRRQTWGLSVSVSQSRSVSVSQSRPNITLMVDSALKNTSLCLSVFLSVCLSLTESVCLSVCLSLRVTKKQQQQQQKSMPCNMSKIRTLSAMAKQHSTTDGDVGRNVLRRRADVLLGTTKSSHSQIGIVGEVIPDSTGRRGVWLLGTGSGPAV